MAKKKYDESEGIWRTIGGRRVFIKTGQSLSEAMIKSGKFKGTKGIQREGYTNEEYQKQEDKIHVAKQQYDTLRNEELKEKMGRAIVSSDEYSSNDIETVINDRLDKEDEIRELQKQYKEMEKKPYTERKMTVSQNEKENLDKLTNEIGKEKTGNDYLPKASKVMTSGTSNRKEVSDNIQAHILEYYDNPVDFMEQMDAMDYLPTRWKQGEEIAKGGSYLIYNGDMADYLDSLNINPKGKKFSEDKSFEMYTSLIGRESERLYNRLEKLYEQYKKEHKASDVSLDDFRKWFK